MMDERFIFEHGHGYGHDWAWGSIWVVMRISQVTYRS